MGMFFLETPEGGLTEVKEKKPLTKKVKIEGKEEVVEIINVNNMTELEEKYKDVGEVKHPGEVMPETPKTEEVSPTGEKSKVVKFPSKYDVNAERKLKQLKKKEKKRQERIKQATEEQQKQLAKVNREIKKIIKELKLTGPDAEMIAINEYERRVNKDVAAYTSQMNEYLLQNDVEFKKILDEKILPMLENTPGMDEFQKIRFRRMRDDIDKVIDYKFLDDTIDISPWLKEPTSEELSNITFTEAELNIADENERGKLMKLKEFKLSIDVVKLGDANLRLIGKLFELETKINAHSNVFVGVQQKFIKPSDILMTKLFNPFPVAKVKLFKMFCDLTDTLDEHSMYLFNKMLGSFLKLETDELLRSKVEKLNTL